MTSGAPCSAPLTWEALVDYWAGDVGADVVDATDDHLMGCGRCSALSARVSTVTEGMREMIPPVIDHTRLVALHARGLVIAENVILPDERHTATFAADTDLLVHRLGGLDLQGALRVGVAIVVEESGAVLLTVPSVPFDRAKGEVLIACQRHFQAFPPNIVVEVDVYTSEQGGSDRHARYPIPHVFEPRARASERP